MDYELFTTPTGEKALKKLPPEVRQHLLKELQILKTNPNAGKRLEGEFRYLRSLHTQFTGTSYRIAYEIDEKQKAVIIRYAASRENFYKKLRHLPLKRTT